MNVFDGNLNVIDDFYNKFRKVSLLFLLFPTFWCFFCEILDNSITILINFFNSFLDDLIIFALPVFLGGFCD